MSRPKLYEEKRVATAVRLPVSLRDRLQQVATERDVSVNLLVMRAIADYLRRLPPSEAQLDPVSGASQRIAEAGPNPGETQ